MAKMGKVKKYRRKYKAGAYLRSTRFHGINIGNISGINGKTTIIAPHVKPDNIPNHSDTIVKVEPTVNADNIPDLTTGRGCGRKK